MSGGCFLAAWHRFQIPGSGIFRTSLGVDFEKRLRKDVRGNRTFGFLGEFYLETQLKRAWLLLFLKKSKKPLKSAQKGKDLPIETGSAGERRREYTIEVLNRAVTVR